MTLAPLRGKEQIIAVLKAAVGRLSIFLPGEPHKYGISEDTNPTTTKKVIFFVL